MYTSGKDDLLGAITLLINAVVLWTLFICGQLWSISARRVTLKDEKIARISPLCHVHINMPDHYSFKLAEPVTKGHLRPLKEASEA